MIRRSLSLAACRTFSTHGCGWSQMEKLCEFCSLTRYCLKPGENDDEWSFIVTPVLLGVIKQPAAPWMDRRNSTWRRLISIALVLRKHFWNSDRTAFSSIFSDGNVEWVQVRFYEMPGSSDSSRQTSKSSRKRKVTVYSSASSNMFWRDIQCKHIAHFWLNWVNYWKRTIAELMASARFDGDSLVFSTSRVNRF